MISWTTKRNDDNSDSHDYSSQNSDNVYSDDTHEVGIKRIAKVKIRIIPIWIPAIVGVKIQGAMIFIGPKKTISIKDYWKYARCVIAKLQLSGENSCWLRPTCLATSQWYLVISCDISILRHVPVMRGSCFNGTPRLEEKILATQVKPKRVSPPRGCGNQIRKSVLLWFWDHQISSGFVWEKPKLNHAMSPFDWQDFLESEHKGPTRGAFYWCYLSADQLDLRRWHWCDLGFQAGWDISNFATYSPCL